MTQPDLDYTVPPRTHDGDAATSHEAEARSRRTWGPKHGDVLCALRANPGMTGTELCRWFEIWMEAGLSQYWPVDAHARLCEVRKRLSDLAHAKPPLIRRGPTIKGQRESRWFLVD